MTAYLADLAWVDERVQADVGLRIDAEGNLAAVVPGAAEGERIAGLVVPGLANLHCETPLRAMVGLGERHDRAEWRAAADRLLGVLTPEDVEAIAAQTYVECLLAGYTAVGAFHSLHNAPDGRPYDDPAEMALRIAAAAGQAGIGLCLLPVLAPRGEGRPRSLLSIEAYGRLCQDLCRFAPVGVASRSPGAVTADDLRTARLIADLIGPATPMHIALAAERRELAACLASSGVRPARWLLDNADVDGRWCLAHAIHIDAGECRALAASGAILGACPSSDANLGEGVAPVLAYSAAGGRFGIGSGSSVSTSPVEELRWLTYLGRLGRRRRNGTPGRMLIAAAAGGAQALGRPAGAIAPGRLADLVVLDPGHPALVGRRGEAMLDAWVVAGQTTPVRHVMVKGQWVVQHGRHLRGAEIAAAFARTMQRLAGTL